MEKSDTWPDFSVAVSLYPPNTVKDPIQQKTQYSKRRKVSFYSGISQNCLTITLLVK